MNFVKRLGYRFRNKALLQEALTHPSTGNTKNPDAINNYQRLEFLGDAVLGFVIAEALFKQFPQENEGALAKRQAVLVGGEMLANIAKKIGIEKEIIMSTGEENSGGRANNSNIENAMEAIIGAIYLDGGIAAVQKMVMRHWQEAVTAMETPPREAKTQLQEWMQAQGLPAPEYKIVKEEGPSHAPVFTIEVDIEGFPCIRASATSKKKAEKKAATQVIGLIEANTYGK